MSARRARAGLTDADEVLYTKLRAADSQAERAEILRNRPGGPADVERATEILDAYRRKWAK